MNSKKIKVSLGFVAVFVLVSSAFPWGAATHAYIADHIGKTLGLNNSNEIYGAMAPDVFNYMFGAQYMQYLEEQAHGVWPSDESFLKVWYNAPWGLQKAAAYGWVCHNDVWGADFRAHHQAITDFTPVPYPYWPGWVVIKAFELESQLNLTAYLLPRLKDPLHPEIAFALAIEICHNVIETAGDIVLKGVDPFIGLKVGSAAVLRSLDFPLLLVKAYAWDFCRQPFGVGFLKASLIIASAEKEFKEMMVQYGAALLQKPDLAIQSLAGQMADLASGFLGGYVTLPSRDEVVALLIAGTYEAIALCKAGNSFMNEVNATIADLKTAMHHYNY